MKSKQIWILLGIITGLLILISVLFPPTNPSQSGSTFGKNPDGYGAWYAYMKKQGYGIEQLQKSEQNFLESPSTKPTTLVRVYPELFLPYASKELNDWVSKGNRIVLLGVRGNATKAPFKSNFNTDQGEVTIETKRRFIKEEVRAYDNYSLFGRPLIADREGFVVWEKDIEKGKIIYAVTPYLGANAYQDKPGNFAYLAHLVNAPKNRIVVDEFIHGYVDKEELVKNSGTRDWLAYLSRTPLVILAVQTGIMILLYLWAENRRFGKIVPFQSPTRNNNLDYIDALSEVLFKSENYSFLVNKIAKAEQIYIQQKLGMGSASLSPKDLAELWYQQGRGSKTEILNAFQANRSVRGIKEVSDWLSLLARLRKNCG